MNLKEKQIHMIASSIGGINLKEQVGYAFNALTDMKKRGGGESLRPKQHHKVFEQPLLHWSRFAAVQIEKNNVEM